MFVVALALLVLLLIVELLSLVLVFTFVGDFCLPWLNVESDLKKMMGTGWKEKMRNREQWRLVIEEAKAHPGL
jgi:hypothetical protein